MDSDDLVFPSSVGTPPDDSKLRRRFYAALERAGLKRVRFHDLRHSFGTLAVQVFPLSDVRAYMGHADIQTTMIYVHHVPADDAAQRLSGAVQRSGDFLLHGDMKGQSAPSDHSRSHYRPEGVPIENLAEAGEAEPADDFAMRSLAGTKSSAPWHPDGVDSSPAREVLVKTSDQIPQNRELWPGNVRPSS